MNSFPNSASVSFALKNDTVAGELIYDFIDWIEKNEINLYLFRKMNREELEKIETN
ncbi:MAG: hypothetical protein PHO74_07305 [Weeksellaceae bacterium]|nr:hypothetical protein [Weeksellaceae bacterium]